MWVFSSAVIAGYSSVVVCGLLIVVVFPVVEPGVQALELGLQYLWCMGSGAPRYVASSWNRDRTSVSRIDRQILNH